MSCERTDGLFEVFCGQALGGVGIVVLALVVLVLQQPNVVLDLVVVRVHAVHQAHLVQTRHHREDEGVGDQSQAADQEDIQRLIGKRRKEITRRSRKK